MTVDPRPLARAAGPFAPGPLCGEQPPPGRDWAPCLLPAEHASEWHGSDFGAEWRALPLTDPTPTLRATAWACTALALTLGALTGAAYLWRHR